MKTILHCVSVLIALAAGSAFAADLPARTYAKAPVLIDATYNWTGFYAGINAGYAWGNPTGVYVSNTDALFFGAALLSGYSPTNYRANHDGGFGGAQAGYNAQFGNWLIGLEADIQGADIGRTSTLRFVPVGPGASSISTGRDHIDWFGTVRGRAGFVVDRVLFYGTGGLAYGGVDSSATNLNLSNFSNILGSTRETRVGWTAGGGLEWAFAQGWSLKAEYLHLDLGSSDVVAEFTPIIPGPALTTTYRFEHKIETARIGLNYKFGSQVIGKY